MICLDSDFIIDFLKGKEGAVNFINKSHENWITTEINVFEVFLGIYLKKDISERERSIANQFFESIRVLSLSDCGRISAEIFAGLIKLGKRIDQNDCLIASIMVKNGCNKIITGNKKHFSRIKNINVVDY